MGLQVALRATHRSDARPRAAPRRGERARCSTSTHRSRRLCCASAPPRRGWRGAASEIDWRSRRWRSRSSARRRRWPQTHNAVRCISRSVPMRTRSRCGCGCWRMRRDRMASRRFRQPCSLRAWAAIGRRRPRAQRSRSAALSQRSSRASGARGGSSRRSRRSAALRATWTRAFPTSSVILRSRALHSSDQSRVHGWLMFASAGLACRRLRRSSARTSAAAFNDGWRHTMPSRRRLSPPS